MANQGPRATGIEYSTLPEVVPGELQIGGNLEPVYPDLIPVKGEEPVATVEKQTQDATITPWWKRRLIWLIAGVIAVAIALGVGLGVGLTIKDQGGSPSSPGSESTTPFGTPTTFGSNVTSSASACRSTICPSMLAAARINSTDTPGFFVFARGDDKAIWYRRASRDAWDDEWQSLEGEFEGQPAAIASADDRVDVYAVWSDGSVRSKTFQGGAWTNIWTSFGGSSINAPAACSWGDHDINVFATNTDHLVTHRHYNGDVWSPRLSNAWRKWDGFTAAAPAAVCPGTDRIDFVSYGSYSGNLHDLCWMHYNGSFQTWSGNSRPGDGLGYVGDPALVSIDVDTSIAFGIATNGQMYYTEYSTKTEYSNPESLGGNFESTPHVLAGSGGRLDVFAVGTDDRLMHKARVGNTWASDWEDLGGYFNSAPTAIRSDDGWVAVFGLGPDGNMIHGNFTATDNAVWGEGEWFNDSGSLSSNWLRAGPAK